MFLFLPIFLFQLNPLYSCLHFLVEHDYQNILVFSYIQPFFLKVTKVATNNFFNFILAIRHLLCALSLRITHIVCALLLKNLHHNYLMWRVTPIVCAVILIDNVCTVCVIWHIIFLFLFFFFGTTYKFFLAKFIIIIFF